MTQPKLDSSTQTELRRLLLEVTSAESSGLRLAICDNRPLQETLIDAMEEELKLAAVSLQRLRLNLEQPSLQQTLDEFVTQEATPPSKTLVVIPNPCYLLRARLGEAQSQQECFWASLQREQAALDQLQEVVLWLTSPMADHLARTIPALWNRYERFEFLPSLETERSPGSTDVVEDESRSAIAELQRQVAELNEADNPALTDLPQRYGELGDAHLRRYDYQSALICYDTAASLAAARGDRAQQAESLHTLATALQESGRPRRAVEFHHQALSHVQQRENSRDKALILNDLGEAYLQLSQYRQAVDAFHQSLELALEMGDRPLQVSGFNGLAKTHACRGNAPQAIELHQQSLDLARQIGDRPAEAYALGGLGSVFVNLESYRRAMQHYRQSLELIRDVGDRRTEAELLGGLGTTYSLLGQRQRAMERYHQELALAWEVDHRDAEAHALTGLGTVHYWLAQYQTSINLHQRSLALAREIGDRQLEGCVLTNIGNAYLWTAEPQRAIAFYDRHIDLSSDLGARFDQITALTWKGYALEKIGQTAEAQTCYEAAVALSDSMGLSKQARDLSYSASSLAKKGSLRWKLGCLTVCFLIGLGIALLVWWINR